MVLDVKIDQVIAEKIKVKHQSVFFGTPGRTFFVLLITEKVCQKYDHFTHYFFLNDPFPN